MSRLCVKNLPKYVAEDRLREFFSQKGEVTDAKLMRTSDGKSRQFGFVGFRTEREAEEAIKYFDKSFMDSSCIVCEIARKIGDPNIPRPWSRHTLKKQEKLTNEDENAKVNKSSKSAGLKRDKKNIKQESKDEDPQLQEFLEVMQPRSKSKLWANDALTAPSLSRSKKLSCADSSLPLSHPCRILQKCTNFGESNTHPSIFLKSPGNIGKKDGDKQSQGKEINQEKMDTDDELDEVFKKEESLSHSEKSEILDGSCNDEVMTDTDYLRSRVRKDWSDSESTEDDSSDNESDAGGDKNSEDANADNILEPDDTGELLNDGFSRSNNESLEPADPSSSVKNEKEDLESGRLFVRNLPYTTTEEELEEHFRAFGNVSQVHIVVDKDTKRSKGIAFVLYALPESAARALAQLDSSIFQGRLLHVMPAKQKISPEKTETVANTRQSSNTFKQQRQEEKKASEASGNTRSWNTLFMRPDTVVENIARKFGVSKSDLLDREADDLAVRIALGETQVIAETKKALAKSGVNIASLEEYAAGKTDGVKRSNYVILVKNLPYGSSEGELASMFGKFGSVDKIILPSTKTLALVVFLEPAEARAAFRGLAYKRFKDTPLYLEWAPGNILDQTSDSKNDLIVEDDAKRVLLEQQVEGVTDPESPSLYVKNLNFKTSDESLKEHFTNHIKDGRIIGVRVKKHLKNGKNVSMGFGFVEFDSVDTAINVCKDLQGTVLDGHALILKHCHPKKDQVPKKAENGKSSTKLLVRNVAFEATKKDLTQLFSPFGQIKSLKLPVRFDGNHRGFAFVEFATKQEAKNAIEALSNTHLYMRHLVLERAKEGESLEELRARTAAQLGTEQNGFQTTKLSKKRKQMAILDEGSFKFGRIAD